MKGQGPDAGLVQRIVRRDGAEAALAALFRAHGGAVCGYALHLYGRPHLAEERTVGVFVWLAGEGAYGFDPEASSVRAHLVGKIHRDAWADRAVVTDDGGREAALALAVHGRLTYQEVATVLSVSDVHAAQLLWQRLESMRRTAAASRGSFR